MTLALRLFKLFPLILSTLLISRTMAAETPMQNFPAFTSAAETKPCATECAITPSAAFKTKYACDPVDPVSCICANGTASVELRESMSTYCYEKCDGLVGPHLATEILGGYCGQDWEGKTITDPPLEPTTTTVSTTGTTNSTGTGLPPPVPLNNTDGGLKRWETIVLATVIPIVGTILTGWGVWLTLKKHLKDKGNKSENIEPEGVVTDTNA